MDEGERGRGLHRGEPIDGGAQRSAEGGHAPGEPGARGRHGAPLHGRHRIGVEVGEHGEARLLVHVERLGAGDGQVIAPDAEDGLGLGAPPGVGREAHQDLHQRLVARREGRAPPGAHARGAVVTLLDGGRVRGLELGQVTRALGLELARARVAFERAEGIVFGLDEQVREARLPEHAGEIAVDARIELRRRREEPQQLAQLQQHHPLPQAQRPHARREQPRQEALEVGMGLPHRLAVQLERARGDAPGDGALPRGDGRGGGLVGAEEPAGGLGPAGLPRGARLFSRRRRLGLEAHRLGNRRGAAQQAAGDDREQRAQRGRVTAGGIARDRDEGSRRRRLGDDHAGQLGSGRRRSHHGSGRRGRRQRRRVEGGRRRRGRGRRLLAGTEGWPAAREAPREEAEAPAATGEAPAEAPRKEAEAATAEAEAPGAEAEAATVAVAVTPAEEVGR